MNVIEVDKFGPTTISIWMAGATVRATFHRATSPRDHGTEARSGVETRARLSHRPSNVKQTCRPDTRGLRRDRLPSPYDKARRCSRTHSLTIGSGFAGSELDPTAINLNARCQRDLHGPLEQRRTSGGNGLVLTPISLGRCSLRNIGRPSLTCSLLRESPRTGGEIREVLVRCLKLQAASSAAPAVSMSKPLTVLRGGNMIC